MSRTLDSGLEKEATGQVWAAPLCASKLSWHFNENIGDIRATGSRTAVEKPSRQLAAAPIPDAVFSLCRVIS